MRNAGLFLASAVMALVMVTSMVSLPAVAGGGSSVEMSSAGPVQVGDWLVEAADGTSTVATDTDPLTVDAVATESQTFTMATIGEPSSLDPAIDFEDAGAEVIQNVYQTLVWYDRESATYLVPVLATAVPSIENGLISADGMDYTFELRGDVVFHDGTDMTSEDVTYSIQRVLQIHDPSGPGWMLEQVLTDYIGYYVGETVSTYLDGSNNVTWIREVLEPLGYDHVLTEDDIKAVSEVVVEAVGDYTVVFHLTHAYPGFLKIMATTVASVVSKDFVEAHGGIIGGTANDYMNVNTCGSGPFELVDWEFGSKIHLTRFAGYWGEVPVLQDVYILQVDDSESRLSLLENGTVDSAYVLLRDESRFADSPDFTISKGLPAFGMTFAAFNFNIDSTTANTNYGGDITADFFRDVHMRKAFTHLINYSLYIENVVRGNAIQPNGVIPEGMFGYDASVPKYAYDFAAAQAELEQTSWWTSGFTVPLFYNAGNVGRQTVCELVRAGLETIDPRFTATITALDWPVFLDEVYDTNGYMPFYVVGWTADYADPDDYTTPMLDSAYGTYPYFTGYRNESIDALVRQAAGELDETARADMYSQISQLVYDDAPYVWLTQANNFHVERSWVEGYYFNPMYGGLYYAALSKTEQNITIMAVIDATPDVGDVWSNATFDGTGSYSVDGTIVYYWWDLGDGSYAEGSVVEHYYSTAGDYLVSLTVYDDLNQSDTSVIYYRVLGDEMTTPDAYEDDDVYTDASMIFIGETQVHSISDGGADVDWAMFTIDEQTDVMVTTSGPPDAYGDTVLQLFDEYGVPYSAIAYNDDNGYSGWSTIGMTLGPGTYYIMVQSFGMYSEISTYYLTLDLWVPQPPVVELYCESNYVAVGNTVWLYAYAYDPDGYISYFNWDFGDGDVWTYCGSEVGYTYFTIGEYTVTVTAVDNSGLEASASTVIVVVNAPEAVISVTPEVGIVGSPATFDGTGSYSSDGLDIIYYWWDFGDGWGSNEPIAVHTYSQAGTYFVMLYVYDEAWSYGSAQMLYEVVDAAPPVAIAAYDNPRPLVGETVTFDGSWSFDPDGTIVRYIWQFGDGAVAEGMYATHAYAHCGVYEVRLTVVDDSMLSDDNVVYITVASVPIAAFEMTPEKPAAGDVVAFYAYGSYDEAGIVDYTWSFGDGTYANGWEVSHQYTSTGRYTVTLTVTNVYGVQATMSESFTVRGHAPSISGTIVDADLEPVKNAAIRLYADGVLVTHVRTDGSGEFGFGSLEPGAYRLVVSKDGLGAATFVVAFTGVPVDVGEVVLSAGDVFVDLVLAVEARFAT